MMDIHLLTPRGDMLVVQVVDGRVIVPSDFAPQTEKSADFEGHANLSEKSICGAENAP